MDELNTYKKNLRSLLGKAQMEKVFLELEKKLDQSSPRFESFLLLKSQFTTLEDEKQNHTLSREQYLNEASQIRASLLKLIKGLEETDVTPILNFREELKAYEQKILGYEKRLAEGEALIASYKEEQQSILQQLNQALASFQSYEQSLDQQLKAYQDTFDVIEEFFDQAKQQEGIPSARMVELSEQIEQHHKLISQLQQKQQQSSSQLQEQLTDQSQQLAGMKERESRVILRLEKLDTKIGQFSTDSKQAPAIIKSAKGSLPLPEMVLVKGGSFQMADGYQVELSDFEIGKYPVTQEIWEAVMGENPSHWKGEKRPVDSVSWEDCRKFINEISQQTGIYFRFPTEAEWQFAAMGGNQSKGYEYAGSNRLEEVGWYDFNSNGSSQAVGLKKPNELGIHDMSGNVWEWCWDYDRDNFPKGQHSNPQGPSSGSRRVLRGGSWNVSASFCRVAFRSSVDPSFRYDGSGFRLARTP